MTKHIEVLYQYFIKSSGVSTDTRKIKDNCLFFALKGDHFDGNQYAVQALELGAMLAVVDNENLADTKNCFVVEDVLKTLQNLALFHRDKLNTRIIGITGSNGKTTTKELIGRVLAKKYSTFYTQGNLNNHIGVPLSILSINDKTEIAIIEMGANHPGEIAELSHIAKPDYGIITNIGKAHLEGFGDFQGVVKTKNELFRFLAQKQGKAFVNADDPLLMELSAMLPRSTYGSSTEAGLQGKVFRMDPFLKVQLMMQSGEKKVDTKLIGDYNLSNILAAACVGAYFDVDDDQICGAIEDFTPDNNRSQYLETKKNKLILDAYNANPTSMAMALKNFAGLDSGKKMAILGDMRELGSISLDEHLTIIELLQSLNFDDVILVGKEFQAADSKKQFSHFGHVDDALSWILENRIVDHSILIKGSRGIRLEKLVEVL
jgi:UDP-N-acetylmuramoyl-tripeptide--D-alanyl-D-alanine ligase